MPEAKSEVPSEDDKHESSQIAMSAGLSGSHFSEFSPFLHEMSVLQPWRKPRVGDMYAWRASCPFSSDGRASPW